MKNIKTLPIASIRRDSGAQFRDKISETHIGRIMEGIKDGVKIPPIEVFFDGALYWLADGEHRLIAHERVGKTKIAADVCDGTQLDARRRGRSANSEHMGLPRSNKAKRAAVLDAFSDPEWASYSDALVAEKCVVSREFVRQMRSEQGATVAPLDATRKGADGKQYPTRLRPKADADAPAEHVPNLQEVPLDSIQFLYDDPDFQAEYPLSLLTDAGVSFDDPGTGWRAMNGALRENDPVDPTVPLFITIMPDGLPGFYSVQVDWCGMDTYSTNREPEPKEMLVARLAGLGVSQATLKGFTRWTAKPNAANQTVIVFMLERAVQIGSLLHGVDAFYEVTTNPDLQPYAQWQKEHLPTLTDDAATLFREANDIYNRTNGHFTESDQAEFDRIVEVSNQAFKLTPMRQLWADFERTAATMQEALEAA